MHVRNMESDKGNACANQFEIEDDYGNKYFQSYQTIIIKITKKGKYYLDKDYWDFSATTARWRNKYLHKTTAQIEEKISLGVYKLRRLNPEDHHA